VLERVGKYEIKRLLGKGATATVTAIEPSWAVGLRVADVDALPEGSRARFNEAFLEIMAERLSMLSGRLR
jgi:CRP-like cAMP-binding protein